MMVISRLKSGEGKEKHQLVKQMENECHAFMGAYIRSACQQPTFYKFRPQAGVWRESPNIHKMLWKTFTEATKREMR
jgi:hypothetical protein